MFQTIIIGIDGRPQDAEVLALARQLGEPDAEIIATNIAVIDAGLLRASGASTEPDLLDQAEAVVDTFTEPRVRVEGVVTSAESIGQGLREIARGANADLIVVASSRRGLAGRIFAGDAVRDVLRHAPCPVAVATVGHHAEGPLTRVTVGYDGTAEATVALRLAAELGRRDDATVDVIEVVDATASAAAMAGTYAGEMLDDAYRRAEGHLKEIAKEYGLRGTIAVGRAAHELAEASRNSDLLSIGLHHYGVLDRLLVGSTAHALLREQASPLLVTPPLAARAEEHHVADALDSLPDPSTAPELT